MNKNNNSPLVVFHRAASPCPTTESLEADVMKICPDAAVTYKPSYGGSNHPRWYFNGQTPADAVKIIEEKAEGRRVVLITLSAEMQRAASGHDFTLLTVGAPVENTDFPNAFYASSPSHIGAHLQKLVRK